MPPGPIGRMKVRRVPALIVDAVLAPELQPPALQMLAERVDHPPILPFVEAAHRRREHECSRASVTELEQRHVAAKRRAVPTMVLSMHFGLKRQRCRNSEFRFQTSWGQDCE